MVACIGSEGEERETEGFMGGLDRRRAFLLVGDDVLVDLGGRWGWLVTVAATMCDECDECGATKAGEMGKGGAFSSQLSVSTIRWKGSERKGPSRMWPPGRFGRFGNLSLPKGPTADGMDRTTVL